MTVERETAGGYFALNALDGAAAYAAKDRYREQTKHTRERIFW